MIKQSMDGEEVVLNSFWITSPIKIILQESGISKDLDWNIYLKKIEVEIY